MIWSAWGVENQEDWVHLVLFARLTPYWMTDGGGLVLNDPALIFLK